MENGREDKNGRRYTTFGFDSEKKKMSTYFATIEEKFNFTNSIKKFALIIATKKYLFTSVIISPTITQILKIKFIVQYFGRKHVGTELSCEH